MKKSRRFPIFVIAAALAALLAAPAQADAENTDPVAKLPPPSYAVASASPDWLPAPGGLAYKACVHEVPDGAQLDDDGTVSLNGIVIDELPPCPYAGNVPAPEASVSQSLASSAAGAPVPLASGWWLDSWWTSTPQIRSLASTWKVPANPASNGATIFLFPSVTPADGSAIVRPVLQWGVSAAGGGNYWRMANWFVKGGTNAHGSLHAVTTGQTIKGTMFRASGTTAVWNIGFTDPNGGGNVLFGVNTGVTSWRAIQGGVLEVYSASGCNKLPNTTSVKFSSIVVTSTAGTVTPSWTHHRRVTSCSTSISSTNSTTTLGWKTS
jgi:hypothetical protein